MRKRHYNSGSAGMWIATHACLDFNQALLAMELSTFCYVPCNVLEIRWFEQSALRM